MWSVEVIMLPEKGVILALVTLALMIAPVGAKVAAAAPVRTKHKMTPTRAFVPPGSSVCMPVPTDPLLLLIV